MKQQNKTGTIEPIYKVVEGTVDPLSLFSKLAQQSKHAFLLESADLIEKYGEKSIGCVEPCLKIKIKDSSFTIAALNKTGEQFLENIKGDLDFVEKKKVSRKQISGSMRKQNTLQDEESRLQEKSIFDLLRIIGFKLKPRIDLGMPFCGLFGVIAYDAIDYFENLPKQKKSRKELPDLEFYYADKLFVMDHLRKKTYFIANNLQFAGRKEDNDYGCMETIRQYEQAFKNAKPYQESIQHKPVPIKESLTDQEFIALVKKI